MTMIVGRDGHTLIVSPIEENVMRPRAGGDDYLRVGAGGLHGRRSAASEWSTPRRPVQAAVPSQRRPLKTHASEPSSR
jgi:hypothetical protein